MAKDTENEGTAVYRPDERFERARRGWGGIAGWLQGASDAVGSVDNITAGLSGVAENVAAGKSAIHEELNANADAKQERFLEKMTTLRGDNKTQMLMIAAAAVAVIVLFK